VGYWGYIRHSRSNSVASWELGGHGACPVLKSPWVVGNNQVAKSLTRIGTRGTTPHGLKKPKERSAMTQPTIQKILEDHVVQPKA
jgi:hypothetical protein